MQEHTRAAQQYFPTYRIDNDRHEIAIQEYQSAARILESDERIFSVATAVLIISVSAFSAYISSSPFGFTSIAERYVGRSNAPLAAAALILTGSVFLSVYFAARHRAVVLASRKVIVLRRMLGLSFGRVELVLPANRVEGADEPYSIPMFHGWFSYKSIPISIIVIATAIYIILSAERSFAEQIIPRAFGISLFITERLILVSVAVILSTVLVTYRYCLLDDHETLALLAAKVIARFMRLRIIDNFETVIYRARMAAYEAKRLNIDLGSMHRMIVHLEDRQFFDHRGVSIRSVISPVARFVLRGKRSGGSTITQQLMRTLFVKDMKKAIRRKVFELCSARWLDGQFSKSETLDIYISSVRYERGVDGIAAAIRYYFPSGGYGMSDSQKFFLLERISNIRSSLLVRKISEDLDSLRKAEILSQEDCLKAVEVYADQISAGRVKGNPIEISELRNYVQRTAPITT